MISNIGQRQPRQMEDNRRVERLSSNVDVENVEYLSKDAAGLQAGDHGRTCGEPKAFERKITRATAGARMALEGGHFRSPASSDCSGHETSKSSTDDRDVEKLL